MPFAAHHPMQLSSTNYLPALLARLSAKRAIAIPQTLALAMVQKLRLGWAQIKTFTMVIRLSFY